MNKKWFSFVELIVSITILAIISTIWFISYSSYLWDSRDSQRKSDLAQVWSALKVYKQKRWYYPEPWQKFEITLRWDEVAFQGRFDSDVRLNTLDKLPLDPKAQIPYFYSITRNAQEYEMATTLENEDNPIALVNGTYKSVSKDVLPGIILAISPWVWTVEIMNWVNNAGWDGSVNRNRFIFSEQNHNLAYDFVEPYSPQHDWTQLSAIITELEWLNKFWQNTDYRNCVEIKESGKALQTDNQPVTYQIINNSWNLIDRVCTCGTSWCSWDSLP